MFRDASFIAKDKAISRIVSSMTRSDPNVISLYYIWGDIPVAYAVIATGGKQYTVKPGQKYKIEKIPGELGGNIVFSKESVLLVKDGEEISIGTPYLEKATVEATIVQHGRGKKITIIKFKRRKKYRRKQGHRQDFTEIQITKIQAA